MNDVELSGPRFVFITVATGLLLCGCHQPAQHQPEAAAVADREGIPSFTVEVMQLDDGGLSEFLEENAGEPVYLDVTIPAKEFQGGQEHDFAFFTVYEECPEDLNEGEKPSQAKCEGTQYLFPKQALKRDGGLYRLTGTFRPSEKSGPNQGLVSLKLDPVHH